MPIIQSLAQLEKNYGKEGAEIIQDNVQDTLFVGFAPNSTIASDLGLSRSTVKRALDDLCREGLIAKTPAGEKTEVSVRIYTKFSELKTSGLSR